jgi:plastocyanin
MPVRVSVSLAITLLVIGVGSLAAATAAAHELGGQRPEPPGGFVVTARDYTFEPAYPTVAAGTTVSWVNRDGESHTVTSDVGLFDAEIGPGERFSFTFDEPGAYFFFCQPHDWMIGEVDVVPPEELAASALAGAVTPVGGPSADVAILGYEFQPVSVTIRTGDTVTWTNYDPEQHTATAADPAAWTTAVLTGGQSDAVTFPQPGTYPYGCMIHPSMLGEIVVLSSA